jgi:hypothetical protein
VSRIVVPFSSDCFLQQQPDFPVREHDMFETEMLQALANEGIPARQTITSRAAARRSTSSSCYIKPMLKFIPQLCWIGSATLTQNQSAMLASIFCTGAK